MVVGCAVMLVTVFSSRLGFTPVQPDRAKTRSRHGVDEGADESMLGQGAVVMGREGRRPALTPIVARCHDDIVGIAAPARANQPVGQPDTLMAGLNAGRVGPVGEEAIALRHCAGRTEAPAVEL